VVIDSDHAFDNLERMACPTANLHDNVYGIQGNDVASLASGGAREITVGTPPWKVS